MSTNIPDLPPAPSGDKLIMELRALGHPLATAAADEIERLRHEWDMFISFGIIPQRFVKYDEAYAAEFKKKI